MNTSQPARYNSVMSLEEGDYQVLLRPSMPPGCFSCLVLEESQHFLM